MSEQNRTIKQSNTIVMNIRKEDENKIKLYQMLNKIKQEMRKIVGNQIPNSDVADVIDYSISSFGKMIRSRLMILFASFSNNFNDHVDEICKMAALIELTHLASLIHDDIIDDASYRRNNVSLQKKFGKNAAVYAGDYIISRIYYYLAKNSMRLAAIKIAKCIEAMCIGEIGQGRCRYDSRVTLSDYIENIKGKTAALFEASCLFGAGFSNFSKDQMQEIADFGLNFGIIFQIVDDLLDYTSDLENIGKECNKDFIDGIYTYPIICLIYLENNNEELIEILQKNKDHNLCRQDLTKLVKFVNKSGAIDLTKKEIKRLLIRNIEILNSLEGNQMTKYISQSIFDKLQAKI